jgi:hypothetical protein
MSKKILSKILQKHAAQTNPQVHPADMAIGAIIGGGMSAYGATKKHKKMDSGESPFSNKIRHELEHHLETRMNKEKPSFSDRMKERFIRGKLRYANFAQSNPQASALLEGSAGAITGAIAGGTVGAAVRDTRTFKRLAKISSVDCQMIADSIGMKRGLLEKKAQIADVSFNKMASMEVLAKQLSGKKKLAAHEYEFLEYMARLQESTSLSDAVKQASFAQELAKRELLQGIQNKANHSSVQSAIFESNAEPSLQDPNRQERRKELLGIFGGTEQ